MAIRVDRLKGTGMPNQVGVPPVIACDQPATQPSGQCTATNTQCDAHSKWMHDMPEGRVAALEHGSPSHLGDLRFMCLLCARPCTRLLENRAPTGLIVFTGLRSL